MKKETKSQYKDKMKFDSLKIDEIDSDNENQKMKVQD